MALRRPAKRSAKSIPYHKKAPLLSRRGGAFLFLRAACDAYSHTPARGHSGGGGQRWGQPLAQGVRQAHFGRDVSFGDAGPGTNRLDVGGRRFVCRQDHLHVAPQVSFGLR